ncbi:MAG: FAD-dependent thymidylate synthase [Nitrososphaerota archaeon]|nr:FAD-dependent thymidylate synthase [Nitrososphaerota archaeon]
MSKVFELEGISRVCSHQLVRHRIASYDQESQRFSAVEKEDFIVPHSIQGNPEALKVYEDLLKNSVDAFKRLKELDVPKEDARFVLPQSIGTKLVITANARTLMHFFWQRTALQAQWEIRELAELMLKECKKVAPTIFKDIIEA